MRARGQLPTKRGRYDATAGSVAQLPGGGLQVIVLGRPAPQGSKSPTGQEQNPRTKPWRAAILEVCEQLPDSWAPLDGPLTVEMWFNFAPPASAKRGDYPSTKYTYDWDKLGRALGDGLVAGRAIADDARIVDGTVHKRYVWPDEGQPCAVAHVYQLPVSQVS